MTQFRELLWTGGFAAVLFFLVLSLPAWAALALIIALLCGVAGLALYAAAPKHVADVFKRGEREG